MKRKKTLKALDDLNKSLELNPKYLKSLIRRAEVNMEREDYSGAIITVKFKNLIHLPI